MTIPGKVIQFPVERVRRPEQRLSCRLPIELRVEA